MTNEELIRWNRLGFIPGPDEDEVSFRARTSRTGNTVPREHLQWPQEQLEELFDFSPESLDVVYSNKGLSLWEGAACWIDNGQAHLQLRDSFRKGSYLGYQRSEVLAHEAVHAARLMFHEPENEEFFAYATSPKRWRQVLGPLVRRPWEPWLFLMLFAFGIFFETALIAAVCVLTAGFWRLVAQHRRRNRAAQTLMKTLHDLKTVRAVLFRMTDAEIRTLSQNQMPPADDSLRWQLLRRAYFNPR